MNGTIGVYYLYRCQGAGPDEPTRFIFYDSKQNPRFECSVAAEEGFRRCGALELPVPGLEMMRDGVRAMIAARFL